MADLVLVLHAVLVVFNVGALPVIWVGYFRNWTFVRNFYFRILHLVLITIVAAEAVAGMACPLTVWEDALRGQGADSPKAGFIPRILHQLFFFEFPAWVFTMTYLAFFVLVVATFYYVRPRSPRSLSRGTS